MEKKVLANPAAQASAVPLSPGLIAGPFVFISGQVGTDPATGRLAGEDVEAQTRQVLANIQTLLAQEGLDLTDVVKTTVFLTRIGDFQAMNGVYQSFFRTPLPTRSTIGVAALARPELVVEIEAIALRRSAIS
jgi:2-iminobutanoate/2-iminopropanoate deaminase